MISFAVGLVGASKSCAPPRRVVKSMVRGGGEVCDPPRRVVKSMVRGVPPLARLTYKLINIKDNKLTITQSYKQGPHSLVAHKGPADKNRFLHFFEN